MRSNSAVADSEARTEIVVRQACHGDCESVGRFLVGLSPENRYQRFLSSGVGYVSPALIRGMVTVTPSRLALLALDGDTVVGHVMAARAGEHTVDVGIVVAEAYRCRGIGRRLVHEMADSIGAFGATELRCDVLSENYFVLGWLRRSLSDIRVERSGETTTVHGSLIAHAT
ncbi:GNAT family N-acetyltransferase [Pseudonocardia sp. CA-142604]|uniref:GNAT family N-acetyltransferase n=1 Tax=Pseudonocardia sp. CA-142604 TaxID=3240024 RepID=UPI003D902756